MSRPHPPETTVREDGRAVVLFDSSEIQRLIEVIGWALFDYSKSLRGCPPGEIRDTLLVRQHQFRYLRDKLQAAKP